MAVTALPVETLAESIKQELKTSATCTNATLGALRQLLGQEKKEKTTTSGGPSKQKLKGSELKAPVAPTRRKACTKAKFTILEDNTQHATLPTPAQLPFATEVFNSCLKTLSEASKTQSQDNVPHKTSPNRSSSSERNLQVTSPNRKSRPKQQTKAQNSSIEDGSKQDQSLEVVVQCAQAALKTLRSLQKSKGQKETATIQLAQATSALVGRLTNLNMPQVAWQELACLKQQLFTIIKDDHSSDVHSTGQKSSQSSFLNVKSMLEISSVPERSCVLKMVISFQIQVIRVLAQQAASQKIDDLVLAIHLARTSTPPETIMSAFEWGLVSAEYATQQLKILSQTLLVICRAFGTFSHSKGPSKAETLLGLQEIVLRARCYLWRIQASEHDVQRDFWTPLTKYLSNFHEFCNPCRKDHVVACTETLGDLIKVLRACGTKEEDVQTPLSIVMLLIRMSEEAGLNEEALDLCEKTSKRQDFRKGLEYASLVCKVAALRLDNINGCAFDLIEESLLLARAALNDSIKGNSAELDELCRNVMSLHRAIRKFSTRSDLKTPSGDSDPSWRHRTLNCCAQALNGIILFLLRYIGNHPSEANDTGASERYEARLGRIKESARSTLDTFWVMGRHSLEANGPLWEEYESATGNALVLCEKVQGLQKGATTAPSFTVKLSNLYWSRSLKLKAVEAAPENVLAALKKSSDLLTASSLPERQTGKIAEKLERLAVTLTAMKRHSEALEVYNKAIGTFADFGILDPMAREASSTPYQDLWACEQHQTLYRILSGLTHLTMRTKSSALQLFSSENFSPSIKCLLLEQQMHMTTSLKATDIHVPAFTELTKETLKSLDQPSYPIRRLRILHRVFTFATVETNVLPGHLLNDLVSDIDGLDLTESALGLDKGLVRFGTYILTSVQVLAAFIRSRPSFSHCHHAVQSWDAMLRGCESWTDLRDQVEDPHAFYRLLEVLCDFADMQGHGHLRESILQVMNRYLKLQPHTDNAAMSSCLSQLGLQLTRNGYSNQAGHAFAQAKRHLEEAESKTVVSLQWTLAHAEYLVDIANLERSSETLVSAQWLFDIDFPSEVENPSIRRLRLAQDRHLSYAAFVTSRLSIEQQDSYMALKSAKQCVRLTSRIWAGLEKMAGLKPAKVRQRTSDTESSGFEPDGIAQTMNELSLSGADCGSEIRPGFGPAFWPYVSLHFQGLMQMSVASAYNGMFQDSTYYCEQAKCIASAVGSTQHIAMAEASLSNYMARAGFWKESEQLYRDSQNRVQSADLSLQALDLQKRLAQVGLAESATGRFGGHDKLQDPRQILEATAAALRQLLVSSSLPSNDVANLEEPLSKLKLEEKPAGKAKKNIASRPGKSSRPVARKPKPSLPTKKRGAARENVTETLPIARCEQDLKILQARFLIKDNKMQDAAAVLQEQHFPFISNDHRAFTSVLLAKTIVGRAKTILASDAVFCVLPESSVAFPSVIGKKGQSLNLSLKTEARHGTIARTRKATEKSASHCQVGNATELISTARSLLIQVRRSLTCVIDSKIFHEFCLAWYETMMLSSAMGLNTDTGPMSLLSVSSLDRARPFSCEKMAIDLDKMFEDRSRTNDWPSDRTQENNHEIEEPIEMEEADNILKLLPDHWNVVTIQLINEGAEFLLSKLRGAQTPFFLRLPLRRSSSDGCDDPDSVFDYWGGREEMLKIIEHANKSSHDGRASKGNEAKKDWWTEREALDEQIRVLLENIESLWFGGFRGIFSSHTRRIDLLARFSESFQRILDDNLPSRRRPNTIEQECPALRPDVLDLFVALGDPAENDVDDAVTDLLYFVVDILQFHGELNAYDEIDFDVIAIQTIDALRSYHEACGSTATSNAEHTILILDKNLHVFPWESLPCLRGQSVSRLPSLMCLRSRLSMIQSKNNPSAGMEIDRTSGSYILNPSSDLQGTEDTFASRLASSLPNFNSIVARPPTEPVFKSCLTESSLCLYFGHGSGAQYIRGRTIRRLDKCAVTFLMGCSSSKLVECGEFEPHGVPWNYMHAGAPALVGTLWDVTDKDIDRFAMKTLENWGLLSEDDSGKEEAKTPRRPGRSKGKAAKQTKGGRKAAQDETKGERMPLDAAVARGRDACVLRYLNGAAPVIYGIPVSLIDP
ncbi:MAG: hypothetical protein Q9160_001766 [Pyrenula sp. 1 TL-2023]